MNVIVGNHLFKFNNKNNRLKCYFSLPYFTVFGVHRKIYEQ